MDDSIKQLINEIRVKLFTLSESERVEVFNEITDNYCIECGQYGFPCYCLRDLD